MRPLRLLALTAVLLAGLAACQPSDGTIRLTVPIERGCDPMVPRACLLPFPNDLYTVADAGTDTGRRIAFERSAMPANTSGVHIDPAGWAGNDGFSPGALIVTFAPGVDLARSGVAPVDDLGRSLEEDSPVVLLDVDTGERHPHWAELDATAEREEDRTLLIRPARNLLEGHRYIVALRGLVDAGGRPLEAGEVFRAYRDRLATGVPSVEDRRPHMEDLFDELDDAEVARDELYLAWDFTVASERNLSERLLHMRDDAYDALGDGVPAFSIDTVEERPTAGIARRVAGTFDVPNYLTGTGAPGSRLNLGPDGLPVRNGTYRANFLCLVPESAAAAPARAFVYGHGLLGGAREINGFAGFAQRFDVVICATDWIGMSGGDIPNVVSLLGDFSRFPTLADRLQQGILNFQFLGRLLNDERGFASAPAFRLAGRSAFEPGQVFFNGNSQGGILGGAATAISLEWERAVLGVPAMNYSTLLNRSIDYDAFGALQQASYPDPVDQQLTFSLVQMLWDRGENNGYAQHIVDDSYRRTQDHDVLLFEAFGDHQVANVATEVMARTMEIPVREPALAAGRSPDEDPLWGIEPFRRGDDSVLVVWDFGNPAPPLVNLPPRAPEYGEDPHGKGGRVPEVGQMVSDFLRDDGAFVDPCGSGPCQTLG